MIWLLKKIKKIFLWNIYFLYIAKYVPRKNIYTKNKYGKYCIPRIYCETPSARHLLCGEVYEEATISFIKKNYDPKGDIVHAGCSWGDHLPALSSFLGKNRKILGFEPNNLSYNYCLKNIQLNNLENIIMKNCSIGNINEQKFLNVRDVNNKPLAGNSYINLIDEEKNELKSLQKTEVKSLDTIINSNNIVSLMFLDVQGYEEEILKGAFNIISKDKPILILELFNETKFNNSIIKDIGYVHNKRYDNNWVFFHPENNINSLKKNIGSF